MNPRTEPLAESLFLEDIVVGEEWLTPAHTVTAAGIAAFAALTLDHHPLHEDADYCRSRGFPGVIAHGLFGLALMEGLKTHLRLYETTSVASLGWDKVRFTAPILAGDAVRLHMRFAAARSTSRPGRGVVTEALRLVNQRDETVIEAEHASLILGRNSPAVSDGQESPR